MKNICALALLLISWTATAAAGEYYIAQDARTRQCTIVESPPTTTEVVLLESGRVFVNRDEAQKVAGSLSSCSSKAASAIASAQGAHKVRANSDRRSWAKQSKGAPARSRRTESSVAAIVQSQPAGPPNPLSAILTLFR
jgi:hypothetical protein